MKIALTTKPILQYPVFSKPFNLTTDASGYAIGEVLSQGPIGKDLLIAYASRLLNSAEQNYTIEKECLAIVYCAMHFRPYLYGRKFTIVTDLKPLVWMNPLRIPRREFGNRNWNYQTSSSISNTKKNEQMQTQLHCPETPQRCACQSGSEKKTRQIDVHI